MSTSAPDRDAILRAIAEWTIGEQLTLAQQILERAIASSAAHERTPGTDTPARATWDALYGIASNGQEPPSDKQVAQWLDEHRMEKYGS